MDLLSRFALALVIWREARGQSLLGKVLVAQVVENRVGDARWPDTYMAVITQPLQFSSFNAGDPNAVKFPGDHDAAWADCVAAADLVLAAPAVLTQANHYCTAAVHPAWRDDTKIVQREGDHLFFQL